MQGLLNIAMRTAREGAAILARHLDRLDRVKTVGEQSGRLITSTHLEVEQTLFQALQKTYPAHEFHSTVSGRLDDNQSNTAWLLDPLSDTQNFLRGAPGFLLGLACRMDSQINLAVYIDPLLNEEFTATRGNGAYLSGRRLRVSAQSGLADSVIGIELAGRADTADSPSIARQLLDGGVGIRSYGSPVMSMLYCAAGRLDGGVMTGAEAIPLAAAGMILRESGGLLADSSGNPRLTGDTLVFGNPGCFKKLLQLTN